MAQQVITKILDDIDNSEGASTVTFAFQGVQYEIDLGEKNLAKMSKAMQLFIDNARRVGGRRSANGSRAAAGGRRVRNVDTQAIREWARSNGHKIGNKGRIPMSVVEQYQAAQR